ncbi:MAG: glycosyltransferase, partial [Acidobacteria bacterium]|nr:glycosyltransferase [Acidobacteriota bacterium]
RMLAGGLAEQGFEAEIWSYKNPPSDLAPPPVQGVRTRVLPGHGRWPGRLVWGLRRELRATGVGLLHAWMSSANFYGRMAATLCGNLPLLCAERTSRKLLREKMVDRVMSRLSSAMVVNSEGVRNYLRNDVGLRHVPIHLIPNGVDTSRFRPAPENPAYRRRLGIPDHALILGTIGRHIPDKRQDWIIRAVAACKAEGMDVHAIIAGWGSERDKLQAESERAGVANRIHLVGVVRNPAEVLRSYQLFVLPSRREGMPNAALESLATGVPVVATEVAGIYDLMGRNEAQPCGQVVPVHDEDAFQRAIKKYLKDEGLRVAAGRRGRERAQALFSSQAMVASYASLYRKLLR